jgi:hypothetical protein
MPARSSFSIDENERNTLISRDGSDRLLLLEVNNAAKNTQRIPRRRIGQVLKKPRMARSASRALKAPDNPGISPRTIRAGALFQRKNL